MQGHSHAICRRNDAGVVNGRRSNVFPRAFPQARGRGAVSLSAVQTRPLGALGRNIGFGYGISAAFLLPLDRSGLLSLRAEIGESEYGHETRRTAFSESVGDRVEVKVRTSNAVVPVSLGLQGNLAAGSVSMYLHGGVGAMAFYTASRVEPMAGGMPLASTVNQSDVALTWNVGGGFSLPLSNGPRLLLLDVGAQYIGGGKASYLAPGSIVDLPNGHIAITPMESNTHLLAVHLGVRVGL